MLRFTHVSALAVALALAGAAAGQTLDPAFAGSYTLVNLGPAADVPTYYGGLTLKPSDPNTLLIGGAANSAVGAIYAIHVTRDAANHITGFTGPATVYCQAWYNDGGVVFGPGNVLFLARWPVNELGQTKPGSTITDKVIGLTSFGVQSSISALNFVPQGYPGAGRMKITTYAGGLWYEAAIAPDATGTYDLTSVTPVPASTLPGSEGFAYVPLGSPLFPNPSMVVAEFGYGRISVYDLTAAGDPNISTRRTLLTGLTGAEGSFIDPLTGDFLFSTFGGGSHLVAVRGFTAPPNCYPNCDGSTIVPVLNVNDFTCFLNKYAASDPYANCDGSTIPPILNVNDFTCFLNKYAQGCF